MEQKNLAGTGAEEFDPGFFMGLNRYHINRIITENLLAKIDVENHRVSMRDTPTAEEEIEKLTNAPFAFRYAFTAMLIPAYDKIILNMTSAQAGLDQAKIVAALERYRLAKGNYPPTLAELVPAYLAKLKILGICFMIAAWCTDRMATRSRFIPPASMWRTTAVNLCSRTGRTSV